MSDLIRARVEDSLVRLRLRHIAERLDAVLTAAARKEPTYIDFLDGLLGEELAQKRQKRIAMWITIAHFPVQKTLDDFDFKFQPAVDQKLVREAHYWEAIKLLEPILGHVRGPMETQVRLLLAQSYVKNPNWVKRGADQLQHVIETDPRNAEAHYLLGLVFKGGGLKQRAAAMFRRAVELAGAAG